MKAKEIYFCYRHAGIGLTFFPYQLALGISLRWFEGQAMFRIYVGPIKIWGYLGDSGE